MATVDTGLTVHFEALDRSETRIKNWEIESAYLQSTDRFAFTMFSADRAELRDLELQPVQLIVGGASQGFGRIEITEIGGDGSALSCEGRDYISELVECNADPFKKITPEMELGAALLEMMRPVGIRSVTDFENIILAQIRSGVTIQNKSNGKRRTSPRTKKVGDLKPKPGEGIYEFCNRLVARFGATIQPGAARNEVVIDAPNYAQAPLYRLTRTDDPTGSAFNNVKQATARRDFTSFPTTAIFTGTLVPKTPGKSGLGAGLIIDMATLAEAFNTELGRILQRAIAPGRSLDGVQNVLYRLLYHRDQESKTQEQLELAARRAISERLKDTLVYSCSVKGHTDPESGAIWSVNTMAQVDDSICGINEPLWIARRTLRYSPGEGATTDLELWRPESFFIHAEE